MALFSSFQRYQRHIIYLQEMAFFFFFSAVNKEHHVSSRNGVLARTFLHSSQKWRYFFIRYGKWRYKNGADNKVIILYNIIGGR